MNPRNTPGRWLYGLGALLILAGIAGMISLLVTGINRLMPHQRVFVPGSIEVQLEKAGTYTIFVEQVGPTVQVPAGLKVTVAPASGTAPVAVREPAGSSNYHINDRSGISYLVFEVREPGTFVVKGTYEGAQTGPQVTLAIGQDFTGHLLGTILGSLLSLGAGVGGGIVLLFWIYNLRRRSRMA